MPLLEWAESPNRDGVIARYDAEHRGICCSVRSAPGRLDWSAFIEDYFIGKSINMRKAMKMVEDAVNKYANDKEAKSEWRDRIRAEALF